MPYKDPLVRKLKRAEYSEKHYQKNKEAIKAKASKLKRNKRVEWSLFKSTFKCAVCGFSHPAAIDFHHINYDKSNRKVNTLAQNGNYKAAREEIKKCIPLCANCHRIHHHEERANKKKLKGIKKKKKNSP